MPDYSFPKRLRLLRASEFERVFAARRSAADQFVTVYAIANECGHPRLGLVVSRRIGGAVLRNRWKRLLREAFRLSQHELPPMDFVCIPRAGSEPQLTALQRSITRLADQLARKTNSSDAKRAGD